MANNAYDMVQNCAIFPIYQSLCHSKNALFKMVEKMLAKQSAQLKKTS